MLLNNFTTFLIQYKNIYSIKLNLNHEGSKSHMNFLDIPSNGKQFWSNKYHEYK